MIKVSEVKYQKYFPNIIPMIFQSFPSNES